MPTIQEVALKAGVSVATVSYVLNGTGRVGPQTSERVRRAARSLGYSPSLCAQAMKGRRLDAAGFFVDGIAGPIYGEIIEGAQEAFKARGWGLIVGTLNEPAKELAITLARQAWLAGSVVLSGGLATRELLRALAAKTPLVVMDIEPDFPACMPRRGRWVRVGLDNAAGTRAALEHLLDQGVRRLLVLNGNERSNDARERRATVELVARERDVEFLELYDCDFDARVAYETMRALTASGVRFDGLLAANDEMALGAMRALREAGLHVPEDVALAGFDDIEAAKWSNPALSTVRVERRALGGLLARKVMELAGTDGSADEEIAFPVEFVPRASSMRKESV